MTKRLFFLCFLSVIISFSAFGQDLRHKSDSLLKELEKLDTEYPSEDKEVLKEKLIILSQLIRTDSLIIAGLEVEINELSIAVRDLDSLTHTTRFHHSERKLWSEKEDLLMLLLAIMSFLVVILLFTVLTFWIRVRRHLRLNKTLVSDVEESEKRIRDVELQLSDEKRRHASRSEVLQKNMEDLELKVLKLEKLGEMKEKGIISEDEHESRRNDLLKDF